MTLITDLKGPEMMPDITNRAPLSDLPPPNRRKSLRESFGVTLKELSESLGVNIRTVSRWESGDTTPTGQNRIEYARVLDSWAETLKRK